MDNPGDARLPAHRTPTATEVTHPSAIDRVLHNPVRLAMVAALATVPGIAFTEMRRRLRLTDGNLSVHVRRLEEAGYVLVVKEARRRATHTEYRLSPAGRRALDRYLDALQAFVDAVRSATSGPPGAQPPA